jgi:hypothetical protein
MLPLRLSAVQTSVNPTIIRASGLLSKPIIPLSVPLSVDVTTGDKITPREIEYTFKLLFDECTISIMAAVKKSKFLRVSHKSYTTKNYQDVLGFFPWCSRLGVLSSG